MKPLLLFFISVMLLSNNLKAQQIPYNQRTSIQSYNYKTAFIRHRQGLGFAEKEGITTDLDKQDATFKINHGLSNPLPGYISFESANYPNNFFRHQDGRLKIMKLEDN